MVRLLHRLLLAGLLPVAIAEPVTFHVAINGNDAWSGRPPAPTSDGRDGPFRSVPAALAAARQGRAAGAREPLQILVRDGRHELAAPIVLGPEDSGAGPDAPLLIASFPGERPVLSGGMRVTGWQAVSGKPGWWRADLPDVQAGRWRFQQLFVNGRRAQVARTPNDGFLRLRERLGSGSPIELPFRPGDLRPEWAGGGGARLVLLMKWTDLHLPILSVDTNRLVANLPGGPVGAWMDEPDARYWIENTPDALDAPDEWHLDRATGTLTWIAPDGVDPNAAEIVAPRLTTLVRWQGSADGRPVRHVTLRGLTLADADYALPDTGLISPQAAVKVPGTLSAEFAIDCGFEDCTLANLGGYGLELGRGCQRWRVVGNEFRSLGAGGLRLGEPGNPNPSAADANHTHVVTDNRLHQLGRVFAPAVGVIVFQSGTNRIAHNHIRDLYYTGISVGWNWGYRETPCRANVVEFNLVEQIGQGRLSDMGGIYTLGPQAGTVIRNNIFRDVVSYGYGGWGLYTDEGSTGIVLENNVVYRCKSAGFHQHYGRDNVVRNNLLAFNLEHEIMRSRVEEHRSFWFTNNVVIWDSGDLLGSTWAGTTNQFLMDRNLYFDTRAGTNAAAYRFAGETLEAWRERGQDEHSIIADPSLVDPARPELGLRPDSPALRLGFRPIDLGGVGPRPRPTF